MKTNLIIMSIGDRHGQGEKNGNNKRTNTR